MFQEIHIGYVENYLTRSDEAVKQGSHEETDDNSVWDFCLIS